MVASHKHANECNMTNTKQCVFLSHVYKYQIEQNRYLMVECRHVAEVGATVVESGCTACSVPEISCFLIGGAAGFHFVVFWALHSLCFSVLLHRFYFNKRVSRSSVDDIILCLILYLTHIPVFEYRYFHWYVHIHV